MPIRRPWKGLLDRAAPQCAGAVRPGNEPRNCTAAGCVERRAPGDRSRVGHVQGPRGRPRVSKLLRGFGPVAGKIDEFVYTYDPDDAEQLTLAAFNHLDIRGWDRTPSRPTHPLPAAQGALSRRAPRGPGSLGHLALRALVERGRPDSWSRVGFETRHYDLDIKIARKSLRLEGTATLQIEAIDSGRHTLSLELYRDLEVNAVVDGKGRELLVFRSGPEVIVHLPEPSQAGDRLTLRVAFGGRVLKWVGRRTYDLESTDNWYPHCGSIDRATYEVDIEWPRKYDVVGQRKAFSPPGKRASVDGSGAPSTRRPSPSRFRWATSTSRDAASATSI